MQAEPGGVFHVPGQVDIGQWGGLPAELGILPFEELDFEHENGEKSSVILAIPSDPTIQFLDYSAFLNDADKLYSYLHILEYWYTNRHGLNGTRLVNRRSVTYENY